MRDLQFHKISFGAKIKKAPRAIQDNRQIRPAISKFLFLPEVIKIHTGKNTYCSFKIKPHLCALISHNTLRHETTLSSPNRSTPTYF
jgi:hypothetical protein